MTMASQPKSKPDRPMGLVQLLMTAITCGPSAAYAVWRFQGDSQKRPSAPRVRRLGDQAV